MASRFALPGSLSLVFVVLTICAFAALVDGTKCSTGWATCRYGRTCKTNLWGDVTNCGKCGWKCPCGPHATSKCSKGICKFECDKKNGYCDCDGNKYNGCEVHTLTDKKNCGRCGHVCPAPRNFIASCVAGVCQKQCKAGYSHCGSECAQLSTDVENCGLCGYRCPTEANATASCVSGNCQVACNSGFTNCTGVCVSLSTDILNCGNCDNVCPVDDVRYNKTICVDGECGHIGCFPGDATVTLSSGGLKRMIELALGDKVAVRGRDGRLAYEDVYAFGHRDASASSSFVQLTVTPVDADMSDPAVDSRTRELTALHFVPVLSGLSGKVTHKRAQDVSVGERMWGMEGSVVVVSSIAQVQKQGLYNPFTEGGTIVVNGVVASTHSEWFLDELFQVLGLPLHWLPAAYQTLLLPVRMLYSALGKDRYIALYRWLDALVDVAAFGSKLGGTCVATTTVAAAVLAFLLMSRRA